ncbi:glycoside hydrolase family 28 protein [Chitinophaga rhizophila]|uniref:Glycoside hydrolase family 28 protein n=1 Tax=Chitinophaga rhizophila TaxID=2866212 RepID=A0ABS7GHG2_9BACT|nr:glycoside hydrolase family 28 protein [Chitinophaga rhizophila]MBW8686685.1 glycoside hydrolase family 28 protein [Chitinophaga rhizophila]
MKAAVILAALLSGILTHFLPEVPATSKPIVAADEEPAWVRQTGAKQFPAGKKTFWVNNYLADSTGGSLTTTAIQATIDACARAGGGMVRFKPGKYLTGSIFIKSGVLLQVDEGVEIAGSQDIRDYPEIDTRVAGIEMKWPAALINIIGQQKAGIAGKGLINAQGKPFWDIYWKMRKEYEPKGLRWIVDYDAKRPRTLLVANAAHITIRDVTLQQAGFWTVQLLYSSHITVDGIIIRNNVDGHGPSTDGIDIDSSTYVLIENCDIDCNDDNFCLKAGRDWDGLSVARPTAYVVIRHCLARAGAGIITLGSETSGSIRHVIASDLTGNGTSNGLNIKSAVTRGGTIEDIHFKRVVMKKVRTAFQFTMNWNPTYSYSSLPENYRYDSIPVHWKKLLTKVEPAQRGIPIFKDVYISDITLDSVKTVIHAVGLEQSPLSNFHFEGIKGSAATAGNVRYVRGWEWKGNDIATADKTQLTPASFQ